MWFSMKLEVYPACTTALFFIIRDKILRTDVYQLSP